MAWFGLKDEEPTRESVSTTNADALKHLHKELRRIRLDRLTNWALKQEYGMKL